MSSRKRHTEPELKTRLFTSLKPEMAAAYADLQAATGMDDSELLRQGLIRVIRDVKSNGGKLVIETLPG